MKERHVLKTIPSSYIAEVKEHNGAPTLFLDGQPEFYACHWVTSAPRPDKWGPSEVVRQISRATNIHIYAFGISAFEQYFIQEKGSTSRFDFSTVKPSFDQIIKSDPKARFHLRLTVEARAKWWKEFYPEECEVTSVGIQDQSSFASQVGLKKDHDDEEPGPPQGLQSYASQVWRNQVKEFLKAYEAHIRTPLRTVSPTSSSA